MGKEQHTIELNGKRYDVRTGKILSAHQTVQGGHASYTKPVAQQAGVALDGFTKHKKVNRAAHPKTTAHAVHQKTERSKTLMRSAVTKPKIKPTAPAAAPIKRHPTPRVAVDPVRKSRASKIPKSHLVSRFSSAAHKPVPSKTSVLPVRPEPEAPPPIPVLDKHHQVFNKSSQSFQHAIDRATSHTEPHPKKATRRQRVARKLRVGNRTVSIATASLAVLLLVGFIGYQNVPNLAMRVATTRAGVQGSLPGYQPAGFGISGPIHYKSGEITITYKSNTDNRQFQVSQRSSQWNSEALLENHVATERKAFQTFQDSGKTIYIYDNNNATWVDGGVWYEIEGNSSLNNDQLLRMAASM